MDIIFSFLYSSRRYANPIAFAPGCVGAVKVDPKTYTENYWREGDKAVTADIFLDTKGSEFKVPVELGADELQKVDSIKFEVVFEKL